MRSGTFGFEHEKERKLPKSTQGPQVEEEESTCIDKPKGRPRRSVSDGPSRTCILPIRCLIASCCLLIPLLVGFGVGFGIGWAVKDRHSGTSPVPPIVHEDECVETTEVVTTRTFTPCNCTTHPPSPPTSPPPPNCPISCNYYGDSYYDNVLQCNSNEDYYQTNSNTQSMPYAHSPCVCAPNNTCIPRDDDPGPSPPPIFPAIPPSPPNCPTYCDYDGSTTEYQMYQCNPGMSGGDDYHDRYIGSDSETDTLCICAPNNTCISPNEEDQLR